MVEEWIQWEHRYQEPLLDVRRCWIRLECHREVELTSVLNLVFQTEMVPFEKLLEDELYSVPRKERTLAVHHHLGEFHSQFH